MCFDIALERQGRWRCGTAEPACQQAVAIRRTATLPACQGAARTRLLQSQRMGQTSATCTVGWENHVGREWRSPDLHGSPPCRALQVSVAQPVHRQRQAATGQAAQTEKCAPDFQPSSMRAPNPISIIFAACDREDLQGQTRSGPKRIWLKLSLARSDGYFAALIVNLLKSTPRLMPSPAPANASETLPLVNSWAAPDLMSPMSTCPAT